MYFRNSITFSLAAYMAVVLSGCGGSNDSKTPTTSSSASSMSSSAAMSSSLASSASSTASVASSTASSTASSASSAASSAPIAIIQDTTLVLPSSLEVVTNEAAK